MLEIIINLKQWVLSFTQLNIILLLGIKYVNDPVCPGSMALSRGELSE